MLYEKGWGNINRYNTITRLIILVIFWNFSQTFDPVRGIGRGRIGGGQGSVLCDEQIKLISFMPYFINSSQNPLIILSENKSVFGQISSNHRRCLISTNFRVQELEASKKRRNLVWTKSLFLLLKLAPLLWSVLFFCCISLINYFLTEKKVLCILIKHSPNWVWIFQGFFDNIFGWKAAILISKSLNWSSMFWDVGLPSRLHCYEAQWSWTS